MGRPKKRIEENHLKAILRMKPTLKDVAAFFECSEDTVERHIKSKYKLSFAEFRDQNMVHTRFSLIRKAISKAENGDNIMLIFCLKNLCEWRDKQPGEDDKVIVNNISTLTDEQLDSKIDSLIAENNGTKSKA